MNNPCERQQIQAGEGQYGNRNNKDDEIPHVDYFCSSFGRMIFLDKFDKEVIKCCIEIDDEKEVKNRVFRKCHAVLHNNSIYHDSRKSGRAKNNADCEKEDILEIKLGQVGAE